MTFLWGCPTGLSAKHDVIQRSLVQELWRELLFLTCLKKGFCGVGSYLKGVCSGMVFFVVEGGEGTIM